VFGQRPVRDSASERSTHAVLLGYPAEQHGASRNIQLLISEIRFTSLPATRVGYVLEGAGDDSNGRVDSRGFIFRSPPSPSFGTDTQRKRIPLTNH